MREVVQGRSFIAIAEDNLLFVLELPDYNMCRADCILFQVQRIRVNVELKERALALIEIQDDSYEWRNKVNSLTNAVRNKGVI